MNEVYNVTKMVKARVKGKVAESLKHMIKKANPT